MLPARATAPDEPKTSDASALELLAKTLEALRERCSELRLSDSGDKAALVERLLLASNVVAPATDGSKEASSGKVSEKMGPWMRRCIAVWKLSPPYDEEVRGSSALMVRRRIELAGWRFSPCLSFSGSLVLSVYLSVCLSHTPSPNLSLHPSG